MSKNSPAKPGASGDDEPGDISPVEIEPAKDTVSDPETDATVGQEPDGTTPAADTAAGEELDGTSPDVDEPVIGAGENMPPIPEEIREAGRLAPDHWLGMVDPTWNGEGAPPEWAMVGRWRSGLDGEIEEWQDNEDYRPSPRALGWPEPADEVDAAVHLAATGYGPGEDVVKTLAHHEVAVFVKPGGGPLPATTPDGTPVVPVFTSPVYVHTAGRLAFELLKVPDLLDLVPEGHLIYLNPSGPVSMTVELDVLREEIEGHQTRDAGADSGDDQAPDEALPEQTTPVLPRSRPVTTVSLDGPESSSSSGAADSVSGVLSGAQEAEQSDGNSSGEAPGAQAGG
ncbi:type VII secretion system-associated protein (plasmid) [Streptomyces sp. NBC_01717]|uniref:type VII secretion system-associated protein n=1 Tax=Streptomyces sp. NBC_01717 TaxID=2975918 RepID=UPI002E37C454|nr:type VII secretion system-associated protein [Streptomyces sp. NBC_01717]